MFSTKMYSETAIFTSTCKNNQYTNQKKIWENLSNRCRDVLGLHKCEEGNPMWDCLELETRMDADNAESQILVGNMHKASLLDHAFEVILTRKASYALDEILIRMPLTRQ